MTKRQSISKRNRFEVFKRDSFSCQYCGASAPEATLQIDHIKPVSKGGDNSIFNLVTACLDCNSGKSDKELSDQSRLKKEKRQLDILQKRKEQLEMMANWRSDLSDLDNKEAVFLSDLIESITGFQLSDYGLDQLRKILKKHTVEELADSVDAAFSQYFEREPSEETFNHAFLMIDRIAKAKKRGVSEELQQLYYIRGILRNKSPAMNQRYCLQFLEDLVLEGFDAEYLKCLAKSVRSWAMFKNCLLEQTQEKDSA